MSKRNISRTRELTINFNDLAVTADGLKTVAKKIEELEHQYEEDNTTPDLNAALLPINGADPYHDEAVTLISTDFANGEYTIGTPSGAGRATTLRTGRFGAGPTARQTDHMQNIVDRLEIEYAESVMNGTPMADFAGEQNMIVGGNPPNQRVRANLTVNFATATYTFLGSD